MELEKTGNGMVYTWQLAGSQGAAFILFTERTSTEDDMKQAKAWLRENHDVVHLSVADDGDLDYLFKSQYFVDPRCRPLKWYQIEQDEALIRKCRREGMSPTEFVTVHVLPNIERSEHKYLNPVSKDL